MCREELREPGLNPVNRRDKEMCGAHRDVGDTEVEQRVRSRPGRPRQYECLNPLQVVRQGWLKGRVQQVLDRERLGEVRARGLAGSGTGVEVDATGGDDHLSPFESGDVGVCAVQAEVSLGDRQSRCQKPFVDGSELANIQGAEVDRSQNAIGSLVDEQSAQDRADLSIREAGVVGRCPRRVLAGLSCEQPTVVGRNAHALDVAGVDYVPDLH